MSMTFDNLQLKDLTSDAMIALAEGAGKQVVSIVFPTERSGAKTQQGAIRLKNALRQAEELLASNQQETSGLKPLHTLTEHDDFWQHQGRGLAIFAEDQKIEMFRVPRNVEEEVAMDDVPWLLPLISSISEPHAFYTLTVTWEETNLYECDESGCTMVKDEQFPATFRELITPRDPEEQLQYSSHQAVGNRTTTQEAMYHGQGEGERKLEADRLNYLKRVGELASERLYNSKLPLVLAATDEVAGHLESATNLKATVKAAGSPDELKAQELHSRAVEVLSRHLASQVDALRERFGNALAQGKASHDARQVAEAASQGRVDTLLVPENTETGTVALPKGGPTSEEETRQLINRAAVDTLRNSGQVHAIPYAQLPPEGQMGAAVFRY